MNRVLVAALMTTSIIISLPTADAADLMHFSVTQIRQLQVGSPAVRAYLDLADSEGRRFETIPQSSLSATLGEWQAELVNLTPAWTVQQGVAFVFLVDISKSLSPDLFRQMVSGIETWIDSLGLVDRAAIVAFGETSQLIVDFTADKETLRRALASLGPTDNETLLHQALSDALDLTRRLDPDLPGRRVIVIFSDGKDEGSTYQAEDVLAKLRDDPAPVYAIGYSRLRDLGERRAYLDLLERFTFNSGGDFFAAEQTQFAEAYAAIRKTIGQVWIADFVCSSCRPDGSLQRLQVKVELGGQALSSGGSVRLLPLAGGIEPEAEIQAAEIPDPSQTAPEPVDKAGPEPEANRVKTPGFWSENLRWFAGAVSILVVLFLYRQVRRTRVQAHEPRAAVQNDDPDFPPGPIDPRSEPAVLDPSIPVPYPADRPSRPKPASQEPPARRIRRGPPPIQVRLIVVRGSRQGRQYSFIVDERAVVGKRSESDCVLAEEPGIDGAQFELIHEQGGLFIRNLSDRLPTLITGLPLTGKQRLTSDTLIGTGDSVLRIVFF